MSTAWYIVPYIREVNDPRPIRYCQIDDQTEAINASGGAWAESEVLGNRAIAKVRASAVILVQLNGLYKRLPKDKLDDSLSDLSVNARQKIKDEILDMGYMQEELTNFGSIQAKTLKQVLIFMATRRLKPRYDRLTDTIILDGKAEACKPIEEIDALVDTLVSTGNIAELQVGNLKVVLHGDD